MNMMITEFQMPLIPMQTQQ